MAYHSAISLGGSSAGRDEELGAPVLFFYSLAAPKAECCFATMGNEASQVAEPEGWDFTQRLASFGKTSDPFGSPGNISNSNNMARTLRDQCHLMKVALTALGLFPNLAH